MMPKHLAIAVCALSCLLTATTPAAVPARSSEFTTIDVPGGTSTVALDVNASGEIVGSYADGAVTRGYRLTGTAGFTTIDVPGANFTRAAGINARGDVVGTYRLAGEPMNVRHGFLLRDDVFMTIDPPGAVFTNPLGINERGDIVGRFCTRLPCRPEGPNVHGFLLTDGGFTTIDFPGAMGTNAWKISAHGEIIGGYTTAAGAKHVFLSDVRLNSFTNLEIPGAPPVSMENGGINSRGDIVSFFCDVTPCLGSSLDAHGFILVHGRLTIVDVPGATATNAFGINERGNVVGVYEDATGLHGFLLSR